MRRVAESKHRAGVTVPVRLENRFQNALANNPPPQARRESTWCLRLFSHLLCRTTQAQRPGARDATFATATLPPGSLQRMVSDGFILHHQNSPAALSG